MHTVSGFSTSLRKKLLHCRAHGQITGLSPHSDMCGLCGVTLGTSFLETRVALEPFKGHFSILLRTTNKIPNTFTVTETDWHNDRYHICHSDSQGPSSQTARTRRPTHLQQISFIIFSVENRSGQCSDSYSQRSHRHRRRLDGQNNTPESCFFSEGGRRFVLNRVCVKWI